jgi:predicted dehydrogenase
MQTQKTIKWGIIGLGKIAHKFAEDLKKVPNCELHAVASRTKHKAQKFAKKHKANKAFGSYTDLINEGAVDAVYIATPHAFHKRDTLLCLEQKIAVLCEKPLAMNLEEVKSMIDAACHHKVLLMEALWTRFLPSYNYVLDLVRNKTYGNIISLEADFGFKKDFDNSSRLFNKSLGGGSLLDIGIYPIFAALTLIGIPDNISATAEFFKNDVDASCEIIFQYKDKVTAKLKSSFKEDTPTIAKIQFEEATVILNRQFHAPTSVTLIRSKQSNRIKFPVKTHGYNYEISHFNDLLRAGKTQSDLMSFQKSLELIGLLDQVREIIDLHY